MIGAILTGNNVVNIAASALATGLLLSWFGDVGVLYATAIMTVIVVVFTEVLPKTVAINAPDRVALLVAGPISWAVRLFGPLLVGIEAVVRWILRLFGVRVGADQAFLSAHEELRGTVDLLHHEGSVEKHDRDMLGGLLDLRDLVVSDVMIHRTEMITVCADDPPEQVIKAVLAEPVTRIPLWSGNAGKHRRHPARQGPAARDPAGRRRMVEDRREGDRAAALVRARYPAAVRAAQGVPPAQDAVRDGGRRVRRGDGCSSRSRTSSRRSSATSPTSTTSPCRACGRSPTARSMSTAGCRSAISTAPWTGRLPDDEATTIAGLVIHESRSIPEPGQSFTFHGFRFRVLRRHRNRITALRIMPLVRKPMAKSA